ncbi:MAG: adenylate/guanylate cyclase domain-containing protein [Microvirga sp.]
MEAPPLERKLVAILAADVAGYSRMMHRDEEATLASLTTRRDVIDDLIAAGRGAISGTAGDSVLAEFASVVDAVHCAVAIQQAMHKANAGVPDERRMELRIGINVGDVLVKDGTIFGDGVNVASRLEALAAPGSVCITRGVRDHIRDRGEYVFEDLGEHSVKNIDRPVRVFRILFDPQGSTELRESAVPEKALVPTLAPEVGQEAIELEFWQSVQASGDPVEYAAYLERYPEGIFAPLARERLTRPVPPERPAAEPDVSAVELAFWDSVKTSDNPAMLQAYLDKFPDGTFGALAEIRLVELQQADEPDAA